MTSKFSFGQSIEQKALNYLRQNINGLTIKYQLGTFKFNSDSNSVWYSPKIVGDTKKLNLTKSIKASEDNFYKTIHDKKDIFIQTNKSVKVDNEYSVQFNIKTNYNINTLVTNKLDSMGDSARLEMTN